MKPLFDKILIKRDTIQDKYNTSLIIPDNASKRNAPVTGVVIAVGPLVHKDVDYETVNVGDRVLFGLHAGTFIEDDNEDEFFICLDVDILCILEE